MNNKLYYRTETQNKEIVIAEGPRKLPKTWTHPSGVTSSGFDIQSDEELKKLGWLPEDAVGHGATVSDTQVMDKPVLDIKADKVVSTRTIREKTRTELDAEVVEKETQEVQEHDNPQQRFNRLIYNAVHADKPLGPKAFRAYWKNNVA